MLELKNVSYAPEDDTGAKTEILSGIDLSFPAHSVTVITGQNGSGKSTLIKLLMGILFPTEGKICLRGEEITGLSVTERAKLGFTLAFQQPVRFKGVTVKDLLDLASGRNNTLDQLCSYLSDVGLCARNYIDREADGTLSGGELKRIELAAALAKGGEVFLLDEPEAGIDLWSFARLTETFEEIHARQDCTMIIISHQERIISLADEILVIDKGVIARRGTRDEVFSDIVHSTTGGCPVIYGEAKK